MFRDVLEAGWKLACELVGHFRKPGIGHSRSSPPDVARGENGLTGGSNAGKERHQREKGASRTGHPYGAGEESSSLAGGASE